MPWPDRSGCPRRAERSRAFPGHVVASSRPFATAADGRPFRSALRLESTARRDVVFRAALSNQAGSQGLRGSGSGVHVDRLAQLVKSARPTRHVEPRGLTQSAPHAVLGTLVLPLILGAHSLHFGDRVAATGSRGMRSSSIVCVTALYVCSQVAFLWPLGGRASCWGAAPLGRVHTTEPPVAASRR